MSQSLETQTERKTTINKFQEGIERKRKVVKEKKKMLNLNGHKGKKFSLQLAIVVIIEKYRVISFQNENFIIMVKVKLNIRCVKF